MASGRAYERARLRLEALAGRPQDLNARLAALTRLPSLEKAALCLASLAALGALVAGPFLLKKLGFRSQSEIDEERFALKALRGDFRQLPVAGQEGMKGVPPSVLLDIMRS